METTKTVYALRRRIASYGHLRTVTRDKKMLEANDRIIVESSPVLLPGRRRDGIEGEPSRLLANLGHRDGCDRQ